MIKKDNIDKKNILQRDLSTKEIIIALGVCGVIFAYGYLFIYPKYQNYKAKLTTLEGINAEITEYEGGISELPIKKEKLDNLNREIKIKSRMLSHNMEDGMFLIGLSKLMNEVDVDLISYTMDAVVPYETFYAIPTTLSVRGDYRHVREIMYYLEEQKNMTQILDYTMNTYIPKENNEQTNNELTVIVPNNIVYWTDNGNAYHKEECEVFKTELGVDKYKLRMGSSLESKKGNACQVCKPYTVELQDNNIQEEPEKPKSSGIVEAEFKFIMYSSENPILELENDDSSKWKPGKYNPFATTTR